MKGLCVAAVAALSMSAVPARAADEPVSFQVGAGTLTVVAPEVKWSRPGPVCEDFAVEYRMSFPAGSGSWWSVDGGVVTAAGRQAAPVAVRGDAPGSVRSVVRLCPEMAGHGPLHIEISARLSDSATVPVSVPFTLTRMRTRITLTSVRGDAGRTTVRGKASAYHPRTGWQGAEGTVRVRFRAPGKRWRTFGTSMASGGALKGRFEWTRFRRLPAGTKYRAWFVADAKQESSVSAVRRG
jgi:hypothetical protein